MIGTDYGKGWRDRARMVLLLGASSLVGLGVVLGHLLSLSHGGKHE